MLGVPKGIRTPVTTVKGSCPRPLDEGDLNSFDSNARCASLGKLGGGKRDRTADLLHAMQALSQLSYTPKQELNYIHNLPELASATRDHCDALA